MGRNKNFVIGLGNVNGTQELAHNLRLLAVINYRGIVAPYVYRSVYLFYKKRNAAEDAGERL